MEAQIDLHRLRAFTREWRARPPVHELVAAYLGYRPPDESRQGNDLAGENLGGAMRTAANAPVIDDTAWKQRHGQ